MLGISRLKPGRNCSALPGGQLGQLWAPSFKSPSPFEVRSHITLCIQVLPGGAGVAAGSFFFLIHKFFFCLFNDWANS